MSSFGGSMGEIVLENNAFTRGALNQFFQPTFFVYDYFKQKSKNQFYFNSREVS